MRNDAQTKRRREKKDRKRESPCLFFFLLFFFVFTLVCFSPLCVSECPSRSPFMNYSAAPPSSGPNPRLCAAVVPVRLQGSGLLHRAGRCHCHTHISVISPVIFLQWDYSNTTECRCIDLILLWCVCVCGDRSMRCHCTVLPVFH